MRMRPTDKIEFMRMKIVSGGRLMVLYCYGSGFEREEKEEEEEDEDEDEDEKSSNSFIRD